MEGFEERFRGSVEIIGDRYIIGILPFFEGGPELVEPSIMMNAIHGAGCYQVDPVRMRYIVVKVGGREPIIGEDKCVGLHDPTCCILFV